MRRLIPVLVIFACTSSVTQAAPVGTSPATVHVLTQQLLRDVAQTHLYPAGVSAVNAFHQLRTHMSGHPVITQSRGRAPADATGSDLAIPDSVLSSGNGTQGTVTSGQGPFSNQHSSWTGFQSGIAASFDLQPIVTIFYQGSVFADATSAQAYMADGVSHTQDSSASPQDCSSSESVPCKINSFTTTSGDVALYSVAQVNQCVIETGYQGTANQVNANSDSVTKAAADTFALGIQEAKTACTASSPNPAPNPAPQPSISITQVGLVHQVKGKAQTTHTLAGGEQGLFVAIYSATNAGSLTVSGTVSFLKGKTVVGTDPLDAQTLSDGTTTLSAVQAFKAGKKAVHLVAQFNVKLGTTSDTQTLSFTVKAKKKK